MSLASVSAAAQIVSVTAGLFSKGYDPTLDIAASTANMLGAIDRKLDLLYERLDLMQRDLNEIRALIKNTPLRTVELEFLTKLRSETKLIGMLAESKAQYSGDLDIFYDRLLERSIKLNDVLSDMVQLSRDSEYAGVHDVIFAAETMFNTCISLISEEASDYQVRYAIGDVTVFLKQIIDYERQVLEDPNVGVKALQEQGGRALSNFPLVGIRNIADTATVSLLDIAAISNFKIKKETTRVESFGFDRRIGEPYTSYTETHGFIEYEVATKKIRIEGYEPNPLHFVENYESKFLGYEEDLSAAQKADFQYIGKKNSNIGESILNQTNSYNEVVARLAKLRLTSLSLQQHLDVNENRVKLIEEIC